MPRAVKRKLSDMPDITEQLGPTLADAPAADAHAEPASGTDRGQRLKTNKSRSIRGKKQGSDAGNTLTAQEEKSRQEKLRKDALKLLSGAHPLNDTPHPLPPANIRRTAYNVPTPLEKDEELEYSIVEGRVKAKAERAPPPPAGRNDHFAWRQAGDSLRTTENKLYRAWYDKRQEQFDENAETIHRPVYRAQLAARERSDANVARAEARVAKMIANPEKYAPIHTSTVVKDMSRNRETLAVYYACDPVAFEKKRAELKEKGIVATDDDINDLVRDAPRSFHGLPSRVIQHFCERTQDVMAAFAPPVKDPDHSSRHRPPGLFEKDAAAQECSPVAEDANNKGDMVTEQMGSNRDKRAPKTNKKKKLKGEAMTNEEKDWARLVHELSYMEYELEESLCRDTFDMAEQIKAISEQGVDVPDEMFTRFKESIGVLHLVHCWHENGKRTTDHMCSSTDMLGDKGSTRQGVIRAYHHNTRFLRGWINRCFKASVPARDYKQYEQTYNAGRILGEDIPGPFLAQVIVWKCDSHVHRDTLDGEGRWCLTVVGGNFEGGIIYFPDLWLYKPGDILIFRSADLYHCVGPWTPNVMKKEDSITPGRMACVFFSPEHTMRVLNGKPENWFANTAGGHYEEKVEVRPRKKARKE